MSEVVVLLSGGQDSATCLAWSLSQGQQVLTIAFDYGQKHRIELEKAEHISKSFGAKSHEVIPVEALKVLSGAALTNSDIEVEAVASADSMNAHAFAHELPSTFVPGRNMLFFTLAAAYGAKFGIYDLVSGVCRQDRAGYPDCRHEFVDAAQVALSLALDEPVGIITPLMHKTKAETWKMARDLGVLDAIVYDTHTCYNGKREVLHPWGFGCAECPACNERARGWEEAFGSVTT